MASPERPTAPSPNAGPAAAPDRSRLRRLAHVAAIQCGILVVSLVSLEFGLRWLLPQPVGFSYLDDNGILLHVPGRTAFYQAWDAEATVRINSLGFRDDEFTMSKPPDTYRILAVGDSHTEALQVDHNQNFSTLIERALASGTRRLEVLNLGVSGYGTSEELELLRAYAPRFEPDLVIVFYTIANDLLNNVLTGRCHMEGERLACVAPPRPSPRHLAQMRLKAQLGTRFHLYQVVRAATSASVFQTLGLRERNTLTVAILDSVDGDIYAEPEPELIAKGRVLTREILRELRDFDASLGAETWIALVPVREQIEDEEWQALVAKLSHRTLVRDRPQRAILEIAREVGLPAIDVYERFRERAASGDHLYWRVDAHLNSAGHRLMADEVVRALREREPSLLPPTAGTSDRR